MPPWNLFDEEKKPEGIPLEHTFTATLDNVKYDENGIKALFTPYTPCMFEFKIEKENKEMENLRVKLSPPWETYVKELRALFQGDDDVRVLYDRDDCSVSIYVDGNAKGNALKKLLKDNVQFNGMNLRINVIPSNNTTNRIEHKEIWRMAFVDNPNFEGVYVSEGPYGSYKYVIWSRLPAQFFNDNLGDYLGNATMLYEDIARDVFAETFGVFHCTEGIER